MKKTKRIRLHRETIRQLSEEALSGAPGDGRIVLVGSGAPESCCGGGCCTNEASSCLT